MNSIDQFKRNVATEQDIRNIFGYLSKFNGRDGRFNACCPFHEDDTPSFSINIKDGIVLYHCFGCDASGDVIKFVQEKDHIEFNEAIKVLSDLTGVPIPEEFYKNRPKTAIEIEFDNYHQELINNKQALEHLKLRGINDFSCFGYADNKYKLLSRHHNAQYIIEYNPNNDPKYLFPKGFKKDHPFNLNKIRSGDIWLVEGIFDSLYLYQNKGINAVALLGASIKTETISLLKRYENIIVALDNDSIGKKGTLDIIKKFYSNKFKNIFYLDLSGFPYKDINDAYQHNDLSIIDIALKKIKTGYKLLIDEYETKIKDANDLEISKQTNLFLSEVSNYQEVIQNIILSETKQNLNIDFKAELEAYKTILSVNKCKQEIEFILSKEDFNLSNVNQIKSLINDTTSSLFNIEFYSDKDFFKDISIPPKKISSSLISDIYYFAGALSFIGARTGHGKTTFLINEAINLSKEKKVAFFSLEESRKWITSKLFVNNYNRNHYDQLSLSNFLKSYSIYKPEVEEMLKNVYTFDKDNRIEVLENYILYLNKHHNIDIFFIDYLQRIYFQSPQLSRLPRQEQIKQINSKLLNIAKENDIYIISGVQFNRTVTSEDAIKTDMAYREAGDIEQDANLLVNIWFNTDEIYLKYFVAKNRNGKKDIEGILSFDPEKWLISAQNNSFNILQDWKN